MFTLSHYTSKALWIILASSVCIPFLISYNLAPEPSMFNELAAGFLWVLAALWIALKTPARILFASKSLARLLVFLCAMALLIVGQFVLGIGMSLPVVMQGLGILSLCVLCVASGYQAAQNASAENYIDALAWGTIAASVLSTLAGVAQQLSLDLPYVVVAPLNGEMRPYGNIRQPAQMAMLIVIGQLSAWWLLKRQKIAPIGCWLLSFLLALGILLTASRSGLAISILASAVVWMSQGQTKDKLLRKAVWIYLGGMLMIALIVMITSHLSGQHTTLAQRVTANSLISTNQRLPLWINSFTIVAQAPWMGVGFHQFNFGYVMAPIEQYPIGRVTQAHNIVIQWLVEFGVPATLVLLALLYWWLRSLLWRDNIVRVGGLVLGTLGLYSLVEFPFWYLYFSLPSFFLAGLMCARTSQEIPIFQDNKTSAPNPKYTPPRYPSRVLTVCTSIAFAAITVSALDYWTISKLYIRSQDDMHVRLINGMHAGIFSNYAQYAVAVHADPFAIEPSAENLKIYQLATRTALDSAVLSQYVRILSRSNKPEIAVHAIWRLRCYDPENASKVFTDLLAYAEKNQLTIDAKVLAALHTPTPSLLPWSVVVKGI